MASKKNKKVRQKHQHQHHLPKRRHRQNSQHEKAPRNEVPPVMLRAHDNQAGKRTNGVLNQVVGKETVVYVDQFDTLGILEVKAKYTPTDLECLLHDTCPRVQQKHHSPAALSGQQSISNSNNKQLDIGHDSAMTKNSAVHLSGHRSTSNIVAMRNLAENNMDNNNNKPSRCSSDIVRAISY